MVIVSDPDTPGSFRIESSYTLGENPTENDIKTAYLSACDESSISSQFHASIPISSSLYSTSISSLSKATHTVPPISPISVSSRSTLSQSTSRPHDISGSTPPTRHETADVFATKKKYKPVALKVKPVPAALPSEFRIERNIIGDPLATLPTLNPNPLPFRETGRYTAERKAVIDKAHAGDFLWPAERDLMHDVMCKHQDAFAWNDSERGHFREDFFPPIKIPVVAHKPWHERNIPIPPGIYDEVCRLIKRKIDAGVYEPSNSSYRSRWFCVVKKDGTSLRIVHSLEPLNAVTIQHAGVPPHTEHIAEHFCNRACGGMCDLFIGYDERALDPDSRDYTTFQTPFGAMRLVTLPMGWTNSVPIFHDDVTHILQPEIPETTWPYIDDVPIRGPASRYIQSDGSYETIEENPGIRRFIWEHFQGVNRVLQRMKYSGGTFSGFKTVLCAEEITVVGHRCTYEGRKVDHSTIVKIANWGPCKNLSDVRAFLGTIGVCRVFIRNFAHRANALTMLTRKGTRPCREFVNSPCRSYVGLYKLPSIIWPGATREFVNCLALLINGRLIVINQLSFQDTYGLLPV